MSENINNPSHYDPSEVSTCTCASIRRAARVVTQAFDDALRPSGLRSTQFTLLAMLAKRGDAPLTRLADALVMDRTTLTRNIKPLIRRGLIYIQHEEDQRVRNAKLTDAGRQVFEDALPKWVQVQLRISERLGTQRWSGLLDDLTATVSAIKDG